MFLSDYELSAITKKFSLKWKPVVDDDITPGAEYLISDKQIEHNGKTIDVIKKVEGKYFIVATTLVDKAKPYYYFNVSSHLKKTSQKSILLHRARLISFKGLMPDKPIVRHGKLGQNNHNLDNLSWGTHDENMC